MKFILDLDELAGKVISKAVSVDMGESVALIFADETCAYFDVKFYGDSYDLVITDDVQDYLKREAGIISEEEYENLEAAKEEKRGLDRIKRELAELARLKEKYG